MSNNERTEVHEPSPEVQNEMRLHMTLNDLRSLITTKVSIEEREVLIESLEPIMAMLGTVDVTTESRPKTPSGEVLYPRQCVKCGSGMQEGYLSEDGDTLCSDACFFSDGYTKEEYQRDYERGTCFWTEWEWDNGWSEQWTKDGTRYTLCDDGYTWEKKMTKYNVGRIQSFKEYLIVEAFS
jgi:hypothetical protein